MKDDLWRMPAALEALFDADLRGRLSALRRDLHRHPELSLQEERTASQLEQALAELEPAEQSRVGGTGVVARIAGRSREAPVVAIRGDIDALPIQEDTGLEFASVNDGVMHACGHDVHATWTVGAAHLLSRSPAAGDVLVVLQPAEEIGEGAPLILQSGALDGVRAIFGAHVDRRFELGQVVAQSGPMAAAADAFELIIRGKGGHGARPHLCRDPIVAGAHLVTALQTIVSRRVDPGSPSVVTIGSFNAGTAPNIISDTARLQGTLRSVDPTIRRQLESELRHLAAHVASTHGVEAEVRVHGGSPPIVNDEAVTEWARQGIADTMGSQSMVPYGSINMGGEDFAFYLERMPGCFLRVGAREPGSEPIGAHTPQFYAAEGAVFVGAAVLAAAARAASRALSEECLSEVCLSEE